MPMTLNTVFLTVLINAIDVQRNPTMLMNPRIFSRPTKIFALFIKKFLAPSVKLVSRGRA